MNRRVLRQLVGHEDPDLVTFDRLDRGTWALTVVAPQSGYHSRRHLALDRLRDEMELFPVTVLPPWQRPAVQRDDGLIVRTARGIEGRLHGVGRGGRRLGNRLCLDATADRGGAEECEPGGSHEIASGDAHVVLLS